jgi:hypothetical protein
MSITRASRLKMLDDSLRPVALMTTEQQVSSSVTPCHRAWDGTEGRLGLLFKPKDNNLGTIHVTRSNGDGGPVRAQKMQISR